MSHNYQLQVSHVETSSLLSSNYRCYWSYNTCSQGRPGSGKRKKFAKAEQGTSKLRLSFSQLKVPSVRILWTAELSPFANSLLRRKEFWSVFNEKKLIILRKIKKIVTLSNYFMHPCPCFHLNEVALNKTKHDSDVWPRWKHTSFSGLSRPQSPGDENKIETPGKAIERAMIKARKERHHHFHGTLLGSKQFFLYLRRSPEPVCKPDVSMYLAKKG